MDRSIRSTGTSSAVTSGSLRTRRVLFLGVLAILVSGFGALAKLGLSNPGIWPLWLWLKVLIWLVFGGVTVLIRRAPRFAPVLWWALPLLGGAAAYLAIYKP